MDSETIESGQDVDFNDSNIKGTPFKENAVGDIDYGSQESHSFNVSVPKPPDGGWGWVVVFASFMINLIADGVSFSFGILFVDFVEYFESSKAKTSWVGSIFFSMPLLAGPVASYLIDRYGCQRMCILGALLSAVSFVVSIFADSLELLFLTFTLAGLGLALCYVTSIVVIAYYFEKKRSLAMGLAACGTGIGTFIFPPLTMYLLELYDWQGTLLILSGFFLNMTVFGALMRDLECPSKEDDEKRGSPDSCTLEDSERLCSSLVQLPTYLRHSLPIEVISELSSKEGGYLYSLIETHPHLLISKDTNGSSTTKKEKKHKVKTSASNGMLRHPSLTSKLDAAYLRNIKVQKGGMTYRGAMLNIHRYRLRASSCPDIYRNSMVTITEEKPCSFLSDLSDLMLEMFDFSNFKNVGYAIFSISNFLLYACVDVPYVYIPDHSFTLGNDMESASFLISVLGVLNCLGVVVVGYVGDKPWLDSSLVYSACISLSGLSLLFLPLSPDYSTTASLVGVYGLTISANYTLVPVIIVHLISLDNFTGAYGLLLLVQGLASLVGPPVAGLLFDMTGHYDVTFFGTGLCIVVSGVMVVPVAKSFRCCGRKKAPDDPEDQLPRHSNTVRFLEPEQVAGCYPMDSGDNHAPNSVLLLKSGALYNVD